MIVLGGDVLSPAASAGATSPTATTRRRFESIRTKLFLPDDAVVLTGHGSANDDWGANGGRIRSLWEV